MELQIAHPRQFGFNSGEIHNEHDAGRIINPPFEPQRANRFIFTFPTQFELQSWRVLQVQKPSATIEYFDNFQPPIIKWSNMVVDLCELSMPNTTNRLYDVVTSYLLDGREWEFQLATFDSTGVVVEQWRILGRIINIDWGAVSYDNNGFATNQIVIQPSQCWVEF